MVLIKTRSFGPTPTPADINWYKVCKNFTKFTSKVRHLADLEQHRKQVHPHVNSNEPTINESIFPPCKPPLKVNP